MMSQYPGRPDDSVEERTAEDVNRRRPEPSQGQAYERDDEPEIDRDIDRDIDDGDDDDEPRGFGAAVLAGLKELVIVVVLAMALSFIVKTWLFQAFYIPSGSMENTLVKDDRVIVSKLTPGPFDLRRGDVVVFEDPGVPVPWLSGVSEGKNSDLGGPLHDTLVFVGLLPEDAENHLIKRVIGLPGDHIVADGTTGKLKVNGVEIEEPYIKPGDFPSADKSFDITVPEGRVWVMGDHRSDSSDSRWHDDGTGRTGSVPIDKIVGRALFVVWPIDHVTWLGVPERTFDKVPAPTSVTPTTPGTKTPGKGIVTPSQSGKPSASATRAATS